MARVEGKGGERGPGLASAPVHEQEGDDDGSVEGGAI